MIFKTATMQTEYLIAVDKFCVIHNIEISFIRSLQNTGLIEITTIQGTGFIDATQLAQLEKYVRLFNELDINLEGIDTINHLLERITILHHEIITLKNRLRLYEAEK
jgi:hypothetical protein